MRPSQGMVGRQTLPKQSDETHALDQRMVMPEHRHEPVFESAEIFTQMHRNGFGQAEMDIYDRFHRTKIYR